MKRGFAIAPDGGVIQNCCQAVIMEEGNFGEGGFAIAPDGGSNPKLLSVSELILKYIEECNDLT